MRRMCAYAEVSNDDMPRRVKEEEAAAAVGEGEAEAEAEAEAESKPAAAAAPSDVALLPKHTSSMGNMVLIAQVSPPAHSFAQTLAQI
jgi:hypothetical protein